MRGEHFQVVQLFQVAVADVPPHLVAFPDQPGIVAGGVALSRVDEGRVPGPGVGAGQSHPALEQVPRRLGAHPTAGLDVIRLAVGGAGAGVDDDDVPGLEGIADAAQFRLDLGGGDHVTVREPAKVELDAGPETPVQRDFVDGEGALAAVHGRGEVIGGVEMGAVVGDQFHLLDGPGLARRQIVLGQAGEEGAQLGDRRLVIEIANPGSEDRGVRTDVVLQRNGEIDELTGHGLASS